MPIEIRMPSFSASAEDSKLVTWLGKEGDRIAKGKEIAEVETDKATMAIESPDDGVIARILIVAGTAGIRPGTPLAILLREGEELSGDITTPANEPATGGIAKPPSEVMTPVELSAEREAPLRRLASPLARRLAREKDIDIRTLQGSGPKGRVVSIDVEHAGLSQGHRMETEPNAAPVSPVAPLQTALETVRTSYSDRPHREIPLDGMRRTIANRLTSAKQSTPHYYLRRDLCIDDLLSLRTQINRHLGDRNIKLSLNDFFIKACAMALQEVPDCNAIWGGDRILVLEPSDVAVAVAVEGGLYTPVLRDAHVKSISTLSAEIRPLAERARERNLHASECEGGTMTVSNLGMFGVESFDAIINPPQSAILAIGCARKTMVFNEAAGDFVAATLVSATLSVDHRVIDGALGARFLSSIGSHVENPLLMLS